MGGGSPGSSLPAFAQDIAGVLFRDPADAYRATGAGFGPGGTGVFGDVAAGYNAGPASDLFAGLGYSPAVRGGAEMFGRQGYGGGQAAFDANTALAGMGRSGAAGSEALNGMWGNIIQAGSPLFHQLSSLVGTGGGTGAFNQTPGIGEAGRAALAYARDVGPNSDVFNRAADLLRPQVRGAFAARGMAGSGSAINEEGNQVQQLADREVQRANAERAQFLNAAVGSEGASASLTGARNSGVAAAIQGALGGAALPSQIYQQLQGGIGQGIQNLAGAQGLNLAPLQAGQAGLQLFSLASQLPVQVQSQIYNFLRSPQTQIMGALSGTQQEQKQTGNFLGLRK